MKRLLTFFTILFAITYNCAAQNIVTRNEVSVTKAKPLDEKTVVMDSTGKVLTYPEWQKLITTNEYTFKKVDPQDENSAYKLVKMTASQKEFLISRLPPPNESGFFVNGQKMESFRAYDMKGDRVELKDLTGKIVVLNFWFINCPPCRREIPELNKLVEQYATNKDVVFIAIALDQRADIKSFLKDNPFNYRMIANGRQYTSAYELNLFPTNVVLDKTGVVRFNASGFAMNTPSWIKKTIDECLASN